MAAVRGAVLGIDVGFSSQNRTSAACRLDWDNKCVRWKVDHFGNSTVERCKEIADIAGSGELLAVALDGPIRAGRDGEIGKYRACEQMLTRGLQRIGKPGQSNSKSGRQLNLATNEFARIVLGLSDATVSQANHRERIDDRAIVEAFPTTFLGAMVDEPVGLNGARGRRSDSYFRYLVDNGTLECLIRYCLGPVELKCDLAQVQNHDDRAAVVCALTALCVAVGEYVAVGNGDGWIVLPPRSFIEDWVFDTIRANENAAGGSLNVCGRSQLGRDRTCAPSSAAEIVP